MTVVFVHGNPETAAIWRKVRATIAGDSLAVSLPGFGCARPAGFGATKDDYAAWLIDELDRVEGPIDLVGHDWGAILVYRVATTHGARLRSWAADVGHIVHPDYEWHDFAKIWQTPGDGEAFVEAQAALTPDQRAEFFVTMGVPPADALEQASAMDVTMGTCILDLYRSAVPNPHDDWGPWPRPAVPGLVLDPTADPLGHSDLAIETAEALGARYEPLEGIGHFWPYEAPAQGAALLEAFWHSVDAEPQAGSL